MVRQNIMARNLWWNKTDHLMVEMARKQKKGRKGLRTRYSSQGQVPKGLTPCKLVSSPKLSSSPNNPIKL
jgi:hypothetical protein